MNSHAVTTFYNLLLRWSLVQNIRYSILQKLGIKMKYKLFFSSFPSNYNEREILFGKIANQYMAKNTIVLIVKYYIYIYIYI